MDTLAALVIATGRRGLPIEAMSYRLALKGTGSAAVGGAPEPEIPALGETDTGVTREADALALARTLPAQALPSRPWERRISNNATIAGALPIP